MEFSALAAVLLICCAAAFIPRVLGYRSHWFDALMLFAGTTFVWSFLKMLYICARDQADGVQPANLI